MRRGREQGKEWEERRWWDEERRWGKGKRGEGGRHHELHERRGGKESCTIGIA